MIWSSIWRYSGVGAGLRVSPGGSGEVGWGEGAGAEGRAAVGPGRGGLSSCRGRTCRGSDGWWSDLRCCAGIQSCREQDSAEPPGWSRRSYGESPSGSRPPGPLRELVSIAGRSAVPAAGARAAGRRPPRCCSIVRLDRLRQVPLVVGSDGHDPALGECARMTPESRGQQPREPDPRSLRSGCSHRPPPRRWPPRRCRRGVHPLRLRRPRR